jgi:RNA polymerase sigma factor (sigma-70 family)
MSVVPKDLPREAIDAALDGDSTAFRRFYHHYDPVVRWAVGLRVYRWPELVPLRDDIVQEVWVRLLRDRCKVLRYHDPARGKSFGRFLAFVATRLGWRIGSPHLSAAGVEHVEAPEGQDEGDLLMKMLRQDLLERLLERAKPSEQDVELLVGHYFRGETIRQIAERLSINENTAYQRHGRLLERLAKLAEELLEERVGSKADLMAVLIVIAMLAGDGGPGEPSSDEERPRSKVEVSHE